MSDSLQPHELYSPWNSPGQNTGAGSCSLLQGIFLTPGSNPGLPHCRRILYQLSHQEAHRLWEGKIFPKSKDWQMWLYNNLVVVVQLTARSCPTLQSHGLQHARSPCPSSSLGVRKFMSIEWVIHPSHFVTLTFCLQSLPVSWLFPGHWIFTSDEHIQSIHRLFTSNVLELQLRHQPFQCVFRADFL